MGRWMWRRRCVDRSLGLSCKEENTYAGEIGVFLLFAMYQIYSLHVTREREREQKEKEKGKEKDFFFFFF